MTVAVWDFCLADATVDLMAVLRAVQWDAWSVAAMVDEMVVKRVSPVVDSRVVEKAEWKVEWWGCG